MKNSIHQLLSLVILFCATSFSAIADTSEFAGLWKNQTASETKTVASVYVDVKNSRHATIQLYFSGERRNFSMRAVYDRGALVANNVNLGCQEKYQVVLRIMPNKTIGISFRSLVEGKPLFRTCGYQRIQANLVQNRPQTNPNSTVQGTNTNRKQTPRTAPVVQYGIPTNAAQAARYHERQSRQATTNGTTNSGQTRGSYPAPKPVGGPNTQQQGNSKGGTQGSQVVGAPQEKPNTIHNPQTSPLKKNQKTNQTPPVAPQTPPNDNNDIN